MSKRFKAHVDETVPWHRTGSAYDRFRPDEHTWRRYVLNVGDQSWRRRLLTDDLIVENAIGGHRTSVLKGYLLERAFVEMWDYENNGSFGTGCLLHMLLKDDYDISRLNRNQVIERTAATVIQWLGTNVGQGFLETVVRLASEDEFRLNMRLAQRIKVMQALGLWSEPTEREIALEFSENCDGAGI